MNRALAIIVCAVCLCGCASNHGVQHLTHQQTLMLIKAVDAWTVEGGPEPDEVRKLNPLQVYGDHGNVVIALQRDALGEKGYYIVPSTSSFDPRFSPETNWTLKPLDSFAPDLNSIYEYSRTF